MGEGRYLRQITKNQQNTTAIHGQKWFCSWSLNRLANLSASQAISFGVSLLNRYEGKYISDVKIGVCQNAATIALPNKEKTSHWILFRCFAYSTVVGGAIVDRKFIWW